MGVLNKLTDKSIKAFVAQGKPNKKLGDGGSLYLQLTPAGTAVWRLNYRHAGKARTYSIGVHPPKTLADARIERARVRELLKRGLDPVRAKRDEKAANIELEESRRAIPTFREFAESWLLRRARKKNWSEIHSRQVSQSLERNLYASLGSVSISEVSRIQVADAIEKLLKRQKFETASKLVQNVALIFRSAILYSHRTDNPADGIAEELLPSGAMVTHRPALLTFDALGELLRKTDTAPISPQVRLALRLVAFSAARIGNVLTAQWEDFDLDAATPIWVIPRAQMKAKRRDFDHKVILGPTIANDLRQWQRSTGGAGYVFPAPAGGKHVKHETLEKVYRVTLGMRDKHSVHGWRASFSTLAKESGLFKHEVVDLALDHVHSSEVARAYDRGPRLTQRKKLAYWWDKNLRGAESGR